MIDFHVVHSIRASSAASLNLLIAEPGFAGFALSVTPITAPTCVNVERFLAVNQAETRRDNLALAFVKLVKDPRYLELALDLHDSGSYWSVRMSSVVSNTSE